LLLFSIIVLFLVNSPAIRANSTQEPTISWSGIYGGPQYGGQHAVGRSVYETRDGDFIVTGSSGGKIFLIKINSTGNEIWNQTFGNSPHDLGLSVIEASDDGYVVAGRSIEVGAETYDVFLLKTNYSGNLMWKKTFGGPEEDGANSVQRTTDGGYIIVGYTYSFGPGLINVFLIKTDSEGNLLWNRTYGGEHIDQGNDVHQTSDGGFIITGESNSHSGSYYGAFLLKTDSLGNEIWNTTKGGTNYVEGISCEETSDGGYILLGNNYNSPKIIVLIKTDSQGNEEWSKAHGGTGTDRSTEIHQTTDGGYILSATTESRELYPNGALLIKTNSSGDEIWSKSFGGVDSRAWGVIQTREGGYVMVGLSYTHFEGRRYGHVFLVSVGAYANGGNAAKDFSHRNIDWTNTFSNSYYITGNSVQQVTDGGYIILGSLISHEEGDWNVSLIRTDSDGLKLWNRTYGGESNDFGWSVQETSDGGFVLAGYSASFGSGDIDVYVIKTDSEGNELWSRTYGGTERDKGWSIQQTTDGGYIITGYTMSFGAGVSDVYLVKTDTEGNEIWSSTFGGSDSEIGYSVQETSDEGYIITGYTYSFGLEQSDVYLVKTNSTGFMLWNRTFGGQAGDQGYSVRQTSDEGYILAGYTKSYGAGSSDIYLIRTDSVGNMLWNRTFGGEDQEECYSIQLTNDGGYILAGSTNTFTEGTRNFYPIKTDSEGNELWNISIGGFNDEQCWSIQQTEDEGYIILGNTESYGTGLINVFLVKLSTNITEESESPLTNGDFEDALIYDPYTIPGWEDNGLLGVATWPSISLSGASLYLCQYEHGSDVWQNISLNHDDEILTFWYRPRPSENNVSFVVYIDENIFFQSYYEGNNSNYDWIKMRVPIGEMLHAFNLSYGVHELRFSVPPGLEYNNSWSSHIGVDNVTLSVGILQTDPIPNQDFFLFEPGHYVSYNVVDNGTTMGSILDNARVEQVVQEYHQGPPLLTSTKVNEEGGYWRDSVAYFGNFTLEDPVCGDFNDFVMSGSGSWGNQYNYLMLVRVPSPLVNNSYGSFYVHKNAETISITSYTSRLVESKLVSGRLFFDVIQVSFNSTVTLDTTGYYQQWFNGHGEYYLARDIGLIEFSFTNANGTFSMNIDEHGYLMPKTVSGTITYNGTVPAEGYYVGLSTYGTNKGVGHYSMSDDQGQFSFQAYGNVLGRLFFGELKQDGRLNMTTYQEMNGLDFKTDITNLELKLGFLAPEIPSDDWQLLIFVNVGGFDASVSLGFKEDATWGFDSDAGDFVLPPGFTGVEGYFWYPDNPTSPVDLRKLSMSYLPEEYPLNWTLKVHTFSGVSGSAAITWNTSEVNEIPSNYTILLKTDTIEVDMRETTIYEWTAEEDNVYNFMIVIAFEVEFTMKLKAGWNMVSLPMIPDNLTAASILDHVGFWQLVTWSGTGYLISTEFEVGRGYWLLVLEDVNVTISGPPVEILNLDLSTGWSMVGGPNDVVTAMNTFPGFYQLVTWSGTGYVIATDFEPGKGYWALVLEESHIQLSPG